MKHLVLATTLFFLTTAPIHADDINDDVRCLRAYNGWNDVQSILNQDVKGFCFHYNAMELPKQPGVHVFDLTTERAILSVECEIDDLTNIDPRPGICAHVVAGGGWGGVRGNHILMVKSCRIESTHPCDG